MLDRQVVFEREISGGPRRRLEVETAIRDACRDIKGAWRAEVIPSRYSSWWVIRIYRGAFNNFIIASKHQQHAEALRRRVNACIRTAATPSQASPASAA